MDGERFRQEEQRISHQEYGNYTLFSSRRAKDLSPKKGKESLIFKKDKVILTLGRESAPEEREPCHSIAGIRGNFYDL
jgi:hypothetical protein